MPSDSEDVILAVSRSLLRHGLRLATAESCTGGAIAARCTSLAGSSDWFDCAVVSYSLDAKTRLLGVDAALLTSPGPVSEPVARDMVVGLLQRSSAGVAVATTGVAGPGGGAPTAPVGTVWFAWARRSADGAPEVVQTARHEFRGSRAEICRQAVQVALEGVLRLLA